MSLEDRIALEERAKRRAYEQEATRKFDVGPLQMAGTGLGQARTGMIGAAMAEADCSPDHRRWLEQIRDGYRAQADEVQALLDILPSKIPDRAALAIQGLIFRTK